MKNRLIFFALLTTFTLPSHADSLPICTNSGLYFGYSNGVGVTPTSALKQLRQLEIDLAFTPSNNQPAQYDLLYNTTEGYATDLAEVFEQRAAELDASGLLQQRYEYIAATPEDIPSIPLLSAALAAIRQGYESLMIKALAAMSTLSRPITAKDYARHNAQLDAVVTSGQKTC